MFFFISALFSFVHSLFMCAGFLSSVIDLCISLVIYVVIPFIVR